MCKASLVGVSFSDVFRINNIIQVVYNAKLCDMLYNICIPLILVLWSFKDEKQMQKVNNNIVTYIVFISFSNLFYQSEKCDVTQSCHKHDTPRYTYIDPSTGRLLRNTECDLNIFCLLKFQICLGATIKLRLSQNPVDC